MRYWHTWYKAKESAYITIKFKRVYIIIYMLYWEIAIPSYHL
jgi:hypothetical protein